MHLTARRPLDRMKSESLLNFFCEPPFMLRKISYPEKIDEMGALRIQAWKEEPGINREFFSNKTWIDEFDKNAHHWVISVEGNIVASARMTFHETYAMIPHAELFEEWKLGMYNHGPFASFNRLVVDPNYRGRGLSAILDRVRVEFARSQHIKVILAQPIESRIKPLEDLGFLLIGKIGPLFQMPGRQLYFMVNELSPNQ